MDRTARQVAGRRAPWRASTIPGPRGTPSGPARPPKSGARSKFSEEISLLLLELEIRDDLPVAERGQLVEQPRNVFAGRPGGRGAGPDRVALAGGDDRILEPHGVREI